MVTHPLTINAVVRDPTRTITLRREYSRQMRRRFRALQAEIETAGNDLLTSTILGTGQAAAFLTWLQEAASRLVIEPGSDWQLPFTRSAFLRGVRRADQAAAPGGSGLLPVEVVGVMLFEQELRDLHQRYLADLVKITGAMTDQIRAVLNRGAGLEPAEALAAVQDRVSKIGLTRGIVLAVTSVVGTVAAATLSRLESYGINRVVPQLEYVTALDPCEICLGLREQDNGFGPGIYTIEQARDIIPVHPRCRCGWLPVGRPVNPLQFEFIEA